MPYDVIIIGGGLAGCSSARQLATAGWDVALLEKGTYPSHKLCGEFLSPEVQDSFERLGILRAVQEAGAHPITRTRITAPGTASAAHPLPGTALGLSRYALDRLLFEHACAAGADGRTETRVTEVRGSLDEGFVVTAGHETFEGRLVLGAYGKRGVLDRTLQRPFLQETTPYVGFKAHYAGNELPGVIELHGFPGGYCGCSHVEDGRVNVCWIGTADALKAAGGSPEGMIEHALRKNESLAARLDGLTRVTDRFEAVSQVTLAPKALFEHDVCMVGDTAGMIAPLAGDGMAMALSAADLVAPHADRFLRGTTDAAAFKAGYRRDWENAFQTRLAVGRWVHRTAFRPRAAVLLVRALRWIPGFAPALIRATRG